MGRHAYFIAVAVLAAGVAAVVTHFALGLHRNFLTIACDTAVLQCGIVNSLHGNLLCVNGPGGGSILGAHTTFLLLLVAPIYALAPSADTLFVLQVWGVYSSLIPLYLVAEKLLRRPFLAFFVASAVLASPLLFHMALAPFHLETWIVAAVLWSYWFYLRNNRIGFWLSFIFAVCCGEQAALIYIGLGASLLLVEDGMAWRKQYGRIALLGGLAWVILALALVTLFSRGANSFNIYAYNYRQWGVASSFGLPLAVAERPLDAIRSLVSPHRWGHVWMLIGLPLVAAFFSWRSVLLLAPLPLYFLMVGQEFFLYFHAYYFSFAFVAGYLGLLFLLGRPGVAGKWGAAILSGAFVINILLLYPAAGFYLRLDACRDDEFSETLHKVFETIPPAATVYTPHRYSAYLSNRENFVIGDLREEKLDFKAMISAEYATTHVHPEQVDYIVCDYLTDQCGWRAGSQNRELGRRRMENVGRLLQSGQWRIFWSENDVAILSRMGK